MEGGRTAAVAWCHTPSYERYAREIYCSCHPPLPGCTAAFAHLVGLSLPDGTYGVHLYAADAIPQDAGHAAWRRRKTASTGTWQPPAGERFVRAYAQGGNNPFAPLLSEGYEVLLPRGMGTDAAFTLGLARDGR